ncbi:hypothetical protein [Rhodobacter ferrooxidans]|uniref:Uncharacterized protein n=1 Tax=Rhodobacter ferrooxidans TaxID=371731 RepID=C8S583_9RHOB|nr:hypothetical protein [Rhodobacter sp. SW2]EEW23879.1 conserved hypothetical protein [Rhodobacter sp. SW2]
MRHLRWILGLGLALCATPLVAGETYDLLFKPAALDGVSQAGGLDYASAVVIDGKPAPAAQLTLRLAPEGMVDLALMQGTAMQGGGSYPASVGNPVIMYFLETALRDMAAQSGGSPFYIRNRIKESLLTEAEILPVTLHYGDADIAARRITLHPFAQDEARARMGAFADLALAVTVSPDIPGWYYALEASTPAVGAVPGYSNALTLMAAPAGEP